MCVLEHVFLFILHNANYLRGEGGVQKPGKGINGVSFLDVPLYCCILQGEGGEGAR